MSQLLLQHSILRFASLIGINWGENNFVLSKKKQPSTCFLNLVTIKFNWMLPLLANSSRPYEKELLSLFERHSRNECNSLDGSVSLFVPYGREPSSTSRIIKISANEATALHMAVTRP